MTIDSFAAGGNPDSLLGEVCQRFQAAFPGRIGGIYLLGSRALGCAIASSDWDLAVVFRGAVADAERKTAQNLAADIRRSGPLVLELTVLDEAEARRGVRPHIKIGKLVEGDDVLEDCPLKPRTELLGYFSYSALYFSWMVRGKPPLLAYPLAYPDPTGEFFGYEQNGIWTGENTFRPGLGLLVNLAVSIANFHLALEADEFVPNKSLTVARFRQRFPAAPLGAWLQVVFELGRQRWQGTIPAAADDRLALADLCRRTLAFENEGVGLGILQLPQLAAAPDLELKQRLRGVLKVLRSDSPAHAAALAAAGRELA
jgi:hypothetical protein